MSFISFAPCCARKSVWLRFMISLVLILLFSACSDDPSNPVVPDPGTSGKGEPATRITLRLSATADAAQSPITRNGNEKSRAGTSSTIADKYVDDLWLLLYDADGDFLEASYCTAITPVSGSDTQWDADITLYTAFGTKCKVYALANTHDKTLFAGESTLDFSTIAKLKELSLPLSAENPERLWLYTPVGASDARYSIPMRGVGRAGTDSNATTLDTEPGVITLSEDMSVQLHYLLCRVTFKVESVDAVEILNVQLRSIPNALNLFSTASELQTTGGITYLDFPKLEPTSTHDFSHKGTFMWYVPRHQVASHSTAYPASSTHLEVWGYSSDDPSYRLYSFYPHACDDDTSVYDFNLEGGVAYTYNATIIGTYLSSLSKNKHWSSELIAPVALPSEEVVSNCIVVPSADQKFLDNGYSFDIAPQLAAYEKYVADAAKASPSRLLRPTTLLSDSDDWYAEILWMDGKNLVELLSDFSSGVGPTGSIGFILPTSTADAPVSGNAVILLKKKSNRSTVWSWHLWILPGGLDDLKANSTKYTPANTAYASEKLSGHKQFTMLDYNLGATQTGKPTAAVADGDGHPTFGLYYQWGRKDPFPQTGYPGRDASGYYKGDGTPYIVPVAYAPLGTFLLSYSLLNPNTFIRGYTSSDYWAGSDGDFSWGGYNVGSNYGGNGTTVSNIPSYFIENAKTPFDPCPVGYRVPPPGAFDNDSYVGVSGTMPWTFSFGYDWTSATKAPVPSVFPASGCRMSSMGYIDRQGILGRYWASAPSANNCGFELYLCSPVVNPRTSSTRATGLSVRCVASV